MIEFEWEVQKDAALQLIDAEQDEKDRVLRKRVLKFYLYNENPTLQSKQPKFESPHKFLEAMCTRMQIGPSAVLDQLSLLFHGVDFFCKNSFLRYLGLKKHMPAKQFRITWHNASNCSLAFPDIETRNSCLQENFVSPKDKNLSNYAIALIERGQWIELKPDIEAPLKIYVRIGTNEDAKNNHKDAESVYEKAKLIYIQEKQAAEREQKISLLKKGTYELLRKKKIRDFQQWKMTHKKGGFRGAVPSHKLPWHNDFFQYNNNVYKSYQQNRSQTPVSICQLDYRSQKLGDSSAPSPMRADLHAQEFKVQIQKQPRLVEEKRFKGQESGFKKARSPSTKEQESRMDLSQDQSVY